MRSSASPSPKSKRKPASVEDPRTEVTEGKRRSIFVLPPGASLVVRRESTPKRIAAAAQALKRAMPRHARPGEPTAQQVLADIRGR